MRLPVARQMQRISVKSIGGQMFRDSVAMRHAGAHQYWWWTHLVNFPDEQASDIASDEACHVQLRISG